MIITLENIGKKFNGAWLYKGLDYTFEPGNNYALLGRNGSGKSTLLQLIYGYMMPSEGNVSYLSDNLNKKVLSQVEATVNIAFTSPGMELPADSTFNELISFHFSLRNHPQNISKAEVCEKLEIKKADSDKALKYFSSGMLQRVKTGLCLLTHSKVKLLDEPLTNMDKHGAEWYYKLVEQLPKETLIIIASNDPAEYSFCGTKLELG